ncbi:hypothetical protein KXD40_002194 [Peronospora effusa]|uniref:Anaphase-promoting complex subunit 4-like WD40 domain-containing protein n=1 Tax=Peronospora effusa TaxID=542832 RepID=A0A3M6VGL0_9STRA|nr:hypothetical protein DD238_002970 [Peronospora effusa]RQM14675.1 hypothetical protein DD237_004100 [Peronospora effusa]UIZ26886.1 hypothetical protein KXD40_002194 [Peronospora effusa]
MTWIVPNANAVTLGELNGELYSVSRQDSGHISDEFIRRGGCALNPARVTSAKPRPFDQHDSLTDEQGEELDSGALKLIKRALSVTKSFLMDDELDVLRRVLDVAKDAAQRLLKAAMGTEDDELELLDKRQGEQDNGESIVDISWHPTKNVLAVAQLDGVVALYDVESASWDTRVLEHPKQMDIGSIEWGKFTGDVLAVACRTGVFLWKVSMKEKEPVLQEILTHPSNAGFTQASWNEDGSFLAAFAKGSLSVVVFDAIFPRKTELQCPYKLTSLHWSPTGEYLFATTENGVSLMWETLTWKRETWEVAASVRQKVLLSWMPFLHVLMIVMTVLDIIQGCGWSSNGRCLLMAPRNSPLMYPYIFQGCPPSLDAQISSPAVDFAEREPEYICVGFWSSPPLVNLTSKNGVAGTDIFLVLLCMCTCSIVGGKVQNIAWDPSGSRVAVTYQTTAIGFHQAGTATLVAIFSVVWQPFLIFTQSGLLRGPPNAGVPRKLAFASNFKHGALLSVAWSSGLISFHPFYLQDPKAP